MKMTVDQAIERLQVIKKLWGGDIYLTTHANIPDGVNYVEAISVTKVGKSDPYRLVSRGGSIVTHMVRE